MVPLQKLIDANNKTFVAEAYAFRNGVFALNYVEPIGLVVYNPNGDPIIDKKNIPGIDPNKLNFCKMIASDVIQICYHYNAGASDCLVYARYNAVGELLSMWTETCSLFDNDRSEFYTVKHPDAKFRDRPTIKPDDRVWSGIEKRYKSDRVHNQRGLVQKHGEFWSWDSCAAYQLPASRENLNKRCDELKELLTNNTLWTLSTNNEIPGLFGLDDPRVVRIYDFLYNYIHTMHFIDVFGMENKNATSKYDDLFMLAKKRFVEYGKWVKSQTNGGR